MMTLDECYHMMDTIMYVCRMGLTFQEPIDDDDTTTNEEDETEENKMEDYRNDDDRSSCDGATTLMIVEFPRIWRLLIDNTRPRGQKRSSFHSLLIF